MFGRRSTFDNPGRARKKIGAPAELWWIWGARVPSFCGPRAHASSRQLRHASPRDECLHASHAALASSEPDLASSKDLADLLASSGGVCAGRPDVTTLAENDHCSLATVVVPCALQGRPDAATLRRKLSDVVFGQGHDSPMREPIDWAGRESVKFSRTCERCLQAFSGPAPHKPLSVYSDGGLHLLSNVLYCKATS